MVSGAELKQDKKLSVSRKNYFKELALVVQSALVEDTEEDSWMRPC